MKLNCIIDTCSCIYLSKAQFRQKSLLRHLFDVANLNYSKEVGLEIKDHKKDGIPDFIDDKAFRINPRMATIDDYEIKMVGKVMPSRLPGGNKGEINNLIIAIDQVHHLKKNTSIYITDDKKAINGILATWFEAYPVLKLWTSYEVLLFLYAEKVIPSVDIAQNLLQEIVAAKAPQKSERSEKTTQELIKIRDSYTKRLQTISKLFN